MSNPTRDEELKKIVQQHLAEPVIKCEQMAQGACNDAYYLETQSKKYIVKIERTEKEFQPQNSLTVEAQIVRLLDDIQLNLDTPYFVFASSDPEVYCYEYMDGDLLKEVWPTLSENERIEACRTLGEFHAQLGEKISKNIAKGASIKISMSTELHPEVKKEYEEILANQNIPEDWKALARQAKELFDHTSFEPCYQFLHNDAHHENFLVENKKVTGVIDFGESEYGEVTKEFSRYIRDYPSYFEYIVQAFEDSSGKKLSRIRLITNAFLSGLIDNVEAYEKGDEERERSILAISTYRNLIQNVERS